MVAGEESVPEEVSRNPIGGLELPAVQIAGVRDAEEARMLESCGVRYVGFPLRLDVHAEDVGEEEAARIIAGLGPSTRAVLITYLDTAAEIAALCRRLGVEIVQLHGRIGRSLVDELRIREPGLTVIRSLVVGRKHAASLEDDVRETADLVDAYLTDTFDPATGASGATGKTHDWTVSRRLVEISPRPVILAGGLTPENVARAIEEVRPAGVDAHTGVEDESGRKSREKVARFVAQATDAFERFPPR